MNITLNSKAEKFIADEIMEGRYASVDEVVEAAILRLIMDRERGIPAEDLEELRAEIAIGLEQADRGESQDWDIEEIRAEGRRLLEESQKKVG